MASMKYIAAVIFDGLQRANRTRPQKNVGRAVPRFQPSSQVHHRGNLRGSEVEGPIHLAIPLPRDGVQDSELMSCGFGSWHVRYTFNAKKATCQHCLDKAVRMGTMVES